MKWIQRKPKKKPNEYDSVIEALAKIRGIEDVDRFLNPTKSELNDPYLIKNILDASRRIAQAIENGENIVLSFDPDADGLTATTIMYRYLKKYTDNVDYIYGERNDGHGIEEMIDIDTLDEERLKINQSNIKKIENADLLILIDSSTNDVYACKRIIQNYEVEIIILDHHAVEVENPHVLLVNPSQQGDEYPNKQISGAGVVFKTIQVMEDQEYGILGRVDPFDYIDLVAVGMYGDMMKNDVLENRFIVMHGLRNMKNTGLLRMLKSGKVDLFRINSSAIGFTIAPLLNGVARMGNIKLAIDMLLEDNDKTCIQLHKKMKVLNKERKLKQKEIVNKYMKNIDTSKKVLIVIDEQSSKGFNGLVAQQLSEKFQRPAIVGRLHEGTVSGSFRSYGDFDLKTFLSDSALVIETQGHPQAGGISVSKSNLNDLVNYIEYNLPTLNNKESIVMYDLEIEADEVLAYVKPIEQFNTVTGKGFPRINVKITGLTVGERSVMGANLDTVKIISLDKSMEIVKFRTTDQFASELELFDEIDVVGELKLNIWYNFKIKKQVIIPQVLLDDYQLN